MGNMKETHKVFLKFSFQKHPLCFHGKNPLEITKHVYKWVFLGETPPSASSENESGCIFRLVSYPLEQGFWGSEHVGDLRSAPEPEIKRC